MRIITGKFSGKKINSLKNCPSRPTTDKAKESLFNIIHSYYDFEGLTVLDLFAGTGSISFEFASRGAGEIIAVETDMKSHMFIKNTSKELNFSQIQAVKADAFKFIAHCNTTFDIVFADPPYEMEDIDTIPGLIFRFGLVNKTGWFILEHSNKFDFSSHPNFLKTRHYGKVNFSIFENRQEKQI
ncbi:MAG: 16S rRNA (guanine(966)-N(2))-methyltransferase RsmD [Bacteroidia bacterium]|nr:16S rRNA (guanine(966)-N(2))-methyltransferase RsmD [Bacteroidia bacterium]